jgi:arylformamidase
MKIIDLSLPLCEKTPVYPGDPSLEFTQLFNLQEHGWNMTRFSMNTHDATHVNVPLHAKV